MSLLASAFRIIASKLDGMETVEINHVNIQNDIHVYTMVDSSPEEIAQQIKFHLVARQQL